MKKKIWIPIAAGVLLLAILFLPIPQGSYDDGGTREWRALTYRIVDWNRISIDGVYEKLRVYGPADLSASIDDLWKRELDTIDRQIVARVVYTDGGMALLEALNGGQRYHIKLDGLDDIGAVEGSLVEVWYSGALLYSDPPMIAKVKHWQLATDLRHFVYSEEWLDRENAEKYDSNFLLDHIVITAIYQNCFFAEPLIPMPSQIKPYQIKLNGSLSDDWCVGDRVSCTYKNGYCDRSSMRVEVDFLTVEPSDLVDDPMMVYKPVIYLYPTEETEVRVEFDLDGVLTCTYPAYRDGWTVTAAPDGTLTDADGREYYCLYWEGETNAQYDLSKGFCVRGEDTAAFLEGALADLGLTRREANEFIIYWLPQMEQNAYNVISFQTERYTDAARLAITPAPDTLIRVFMAWQPSETYVRLEEQTLTAPAREGFVAVEWGGTKLE